MFWYSKKPKGNVDGFRYNPDSQSWTIQADSSVLEDMANELKE